MQSEKNLGNWIQTFDFGHLLPFLARLPLPIGEGLARCRGLVQAIFDYEWRSMALGQRYIRSRTREAMNIMLPNTGNLKRIRATAARFIHNSREEWQSCLFRHKIMSAISGRSTVERLDELTAIQKQGRGMVLVSCHLDSFCMGIVLMGMRGLRLNAVSTAMIEDLRIHPAVRAFFQNKYRTMETLMSGGIRNCETDMPFFYKALEQGEIVILMGDIPGSKSDIHISFCGRSFRMPLGAWHMAVKTKSLLGAYVCIRESLGTYRVVCLPPFEPDPEDALKSMKPLYSFLETWILKYPQRWVAADLLPAYGN